MCEINRCQSNRLKHVFPFAISKAIHHKNWLISTQIKCAKKKLAKKYRTEMCFANFIHLLFGRPSHPFLLFRYFILLSDLVILRRTQLCQATDDDAHDRVWVYKCENKICWKRIYSRHMRRHWKVNGNSRGEKKQKNENTKNNVLLETSAH